MTVREAIAKVGQEFQLDAEKVKYMEGHLLRITPQLKLDEPLPVRKDRDRQVAEEHMMRILRQIAEPLKSMPATENARKLMDDVADMAAFTGKAIIAAERAERARNN